VGGGEIVAGKVGRALEIKPAGHRTEVVACVLTGREEVGGVETECAVELVVDGAQELVYSSFFFCRLADCFFLLFFGEEDRFPLREPLPLESSEATVAFALRLRAGDFCFCFCRR